MGKLKHSPFLLIVATNGISYEKENPFVVTEEVFGMGFMQHGNGFI